MNTKTSTRGRTFIGIVTSDKMSKTVTVEWNRRHYIPKYERYEKRRTKVKAHNPDDIDARTGDKVIIMETRPLSKTKRFTIIKKLGGEEAEEAPAAPKEAPKKEQSAKRAAKKKAAPKKTPKKKAAPKKKAEKSEQA